jgi:hypothetical protein
MLSGINNLEEKKDNLEEEDNLEEVDNLKEVDNLEEVKYNLEEVKNDLEGIKDNSVVDRRQFFYIINTTFSTESGHLLKIEFDFETTNPEKVWIDVKCPNFVFESCSELDFQKININRRKLTRLENFENNDIIGECKYSNDYHSSNILFIFPEIFYFFPSQIFELNMPWKDNDENENFKNSNVLILELKEGINRTFKYSKYNIMKPNEVYLNIEKIYYQNYENKIDTFIIQTDNELNRRIYFISYCQELKQIENFFYECVTDLNCDEIKSIQKTMNPKIDFQMKLQCEGRTQFYFYKYDNKNEGNDWWEYCSFLYNHYNIEYFFLEISDNNIISVNDIEREHWDYIMNLCQNLELKIKSNNKYWYCEIKSDCSVVIEDILKKFFQNSEAEVKCEEDIHYFYKNFSNYNPEDLEKYEYCPYVFYKFHEYDYSKFNASNPLMNDQDSSLSNFFCNNEIYLRYCNKKIERETSNNGKSIIKCYTSKEEKFMFANFINDEEYQIEIYYNEGVINFYKCPEIEDKDWKKCYNIICDKYGTDKNFTVKRKNSNLNSISEIYSDGVNINSYLNFCYIELLDFCELEKYYQEQEDIIYCKTSLDCQESINKLKSMNTEFKIDLKITCIDKTIKWHNYDKYDKETGNQLEKCCHIIHLIKKIDYFIIEFNENDDNKIYDINSDKPLNDICTSYFSYCNENLIIRNKEQDSIYCESSIEECPNVENNEIIKHQIEMEIHCKNSIIYLHKYNYF